MHRFGAAGLEGLGGLLGAGGYPGIGAGIWRACGPFWWLLGAFAGLAVAGGGSGTLAMPIFTVRPSSTVRLYSIGLACLSLALSVGQSQGLACPSLSLGSHGVCLLRIPKQAARRNEVSMLSIHRIMKPRYLVIWIVSVALCRS